MGLTINTNVASINAQQNLSRVTDRLSKNYSRLSSGLRIATASDDSAGLAISERLRAQTKSLSRAQLNANDGISMVQTAEGALNEVSAMLVRMRELAVESNNGSLTASDKDSLDQEFQQLVSEIDRIAQATSFNGIDLLASSQTITFQVGDGTASNVDTIDMALNSMKKADLSISTLDNRRRRRGHHGHHEHRLGHQQGDRGPGFPRCGPEPSQLDHLEPGRGHREHLGRRVPDPRRGCGLRDGRSDQELDHAADRPVHAGPGQPAASGGALPPPVG